MPDDEVKCPLCGATTIEQDGITFPCEACQIRAVDENRYRRDYYREYTGWTPKSSRGERL